MSSDLLQIGASGTRAYQAAMGAIADNIANADTPGYSRRTLALTESAAGNSASLFYRTTATFYGVEVRGVVRAADPYLDSAARQTTMALGSADQRARWMNDVQTALNDTDLGVGQRFSGMFASVERLASNPTDTTLRSDVLFSFEQINTAFQQSRSDLVSIRTAVGSSATNEVASLNDALGQLADANEGLRRVAEGTASHASLMDARDQALADVSQRLNVTVTFGANGVANVDYGGQSLVQNNLKQNVAVTQDADGLLSFSIAGGAALPAPGSGSLGGMTSSASVVRDRIDALDDLATRYVTELNDWHTGGLTAGGATGGPLLTIGANAGEIALAITNPADLAGRSAGGVINGNLLAISGLRGNGSIEDAWTGLISLQGSVANNAQSVKTAAASRDTMAQQARAEVVGVNLDREAADLIRLQQAYQGSARVIQVARELIQTIFSIFQ